MICSLGTHESFSIFWNGEHCLPILSSIFELKTKLHSGNCLIFPFGDAFHFTSVSVVCLNLLFVWDSVFPRVLVHYVMASFVLCFYHYFCYYHFFFIFPFLSSAGCVGLHIYVHRTILCLWKRHSFHLIHSFWIEMREKRLGKMRKPIEKPTVMLEFLLAGTIWHSYLVCYAAVFFSFHSCILILIMTRFMHVFFSPQSYHYFQLNIYFFVLYASIRKD